MAFVSFFFGVISTTDLGFNRLNSFHGMPFDGQRRQFGSNDDTLGS